jgi:proteinase inhibitor I4 serpin
MGRVNPVFETIAYQQQVRLIVREDGTVAAAVSKHGDGVTAPNPGPTTDFRIDHPYVMRLRDLSTGVALFEAVINNPS